ncbi:MAG: T9SS type A sorting domain-containing protein [Salinivirgaceae bacterium]|nr:T9SS type A sorting domain-containing protein [Salinivirgaceae bacterium]
MKIFSFLLMFVACAFFATAQTGFAPRYVSKTKETKIKTTNKVQEPVKAPGDVLWEHDFNGELWAATSEDGMPVPSEAPEGWALTDGTGNGFYWRWDTVGSRGIFTSPSDADCHTPQVPLESETAENGFLILESDYFNSAFDCNSYTTDVLDASVVYEAGLDFSNNPSVHLIFTQWNRFCCSPFGDDVGAFFEVSTDGGTTWIKKHVEFGIINTGNPNTDGETKVDISNMVGGEANIQFRFRQLGLDSYHWEIDDLRFIEPFEHDILLMDYWNNYIEDYDGGAEEGGFANENDFEEGFYNYPWFMIKDFKSYVVSFQNNGSIDQSGVAHHVDVTKNGAPFTSFESDYGELATGVIDTTKTMGDFVPDGKGLYTIAHYTTADDQDQDLSNDTLKRDIVVGSGILSAVDYKHRDGSIMPSNWNSHVNGRGLGTRFELPEPSEHGDGTADYYVVEGLEFYLTSQRYSEQTELIENGGATMYAELYRFDETAQEWALIISSDEYTLQISDTASFVYIPYATDGSSEFLTEGGTYLTNLAFYGLWMDPFDREQSVYVGENMTQKVAIGATMLVDPGASGSDPVGWVNAGACIALHMDFSDPYPKTEYETTFYVTADGAAYEGATVKVAGIEVDTDTNGNAVFMLEDGVYPYAVDAEIFAELLEGEFTVDGAAQTVPVGLSSIFTVNTVDFNIYPNPSNGVFNVDVDGNATVTVMNVTGQVVENTTISGSQTITLDNVNAGVYFVRVQVGENVATKQLIIR